MDTQTTILLGGEVTPEDVAEVDRVLQIHWPRLRARADDARESANAILSPENIQLAAAVAGILSFLLSLWRNTKKKDEKSADANKLLADALRRVGSVGYELNDLRVREESIELRVNDIPQNSRLDFQLLATDRETEIRVSLRAASNEVQR